MADGGRGLRLPHEAAAETGRQDRLRPRQLERHLPPQHGIDRQKHNPERSPAQLADDFKAAHPHSLAVGTPWFL